MSRIDVGRDLNLSQDLERRAWLMYFSVQIAVLKIELKRHEIDLTEQCHGTSGLSSKLTRRAQRSEI